MRGVVIAPAGRAAPISAFNRGLRFHFGISSITKGPSLKYHLPSNIEALLVSEEPFTFILSILDLRRRNVPLKKLI